MPPFDCTDLSRWIGALTARSLPPDWMYWRKASDALVAVDVRTLLWLRCDSDRVKRRPVPRIASAGKIAPRYDVEFTQIGCDLELV